MNSEEKKFIGNKLKRSSSCTKKSNKSDGSGDYVFANKSNSAFTIYHCKNYKQFQRYLSLIKKPSYTTDQKFLDLSGISQAFKNNNLEKEIKLNVHIDNIDKSKIFPISSSKKFFNDSKKEKTANFIFSNIFKEEDKESEDNLFKHTHEFINGYYRRSKISDFCPDFKYHFQNNDDEIFYDIDDQELFIRSIKIFHYKDYGISHFYAPKGSGKSILFRSIFANFVNYEDDPERYYPYMFFDIKLLNALINKLDTSEIKKILLHESYSLFKEREKAVNFIDKININLYKDNIMGMIEQIIKIALQDVEGENRAFVLDGYSCEYDPDNILDKLKEDVKNNNKYFLQIIYDIKNSKDGEILYYNINPNNYINYYVEENINTYIYYEKLKLFSELRTNFSDDKIPEKYIQTFGENVSYFFEYKKEQKNITFDEFINIKRSQIKEEIIHFCDSNTQGRYYLNEIDRKINDNEKFYYDEIIKYVPSNYVEINIEPKPISKNRGSDIDNYVKNKSYSLNYSYPLVKSVVEEIIKAQGFINMKNDEFLKLPAGALETNFDIEMNRILKELMKKEYFFEHSKKTQICINDILEKKEPNQAQVYKYDDVVSIVNKYYMKKKKEFDEVNYKNFTCIGVFQNNFCGKAFDILFFTRKEDEISFDMNLIQVKCSDSYVENNDELFEQLSYIKNKFVYLLNIEINNVFIYYLSIKQKPKKFASSNSKRAFLYNVKTDKFIDFFDKEYKKFPFLTDALIKLNLDNDDIIKNSIISTINRFYHKSFVLNEKEGRINDFKGKNPEEMKNILKNNELYAYITSKQFNYYFIIDNNYGSINYTCPVECESIYEKVFNIKY